MYQKLRKLISYLPIITILAAIDQASKTYLISYLKTQFGMSLKVSSYFTFVYAWNYGISFGLFGNYYQYSNYAFLAINCIITGYLFSLIHSSSSKIQALGFAIIIGGAIGNIIDRIFRGAVFDFLYFHYNQYSFPAFNLADSFINIGVFLVIISFFKVR
jgi:signal peptidase II